MKEIEAYAAGVGIQPTTVLQRAANLGGAKWRSWENGGGCSMHTADRIRAYMAANPPRKSGQDEAAA